MEITGRVTRITKIKSAFPAIILSPWALLCIHQLYLSNRLLRASKCSVFTLTSKFVSPVSLALQLSVPRQKVSPSASSYVVCETPEIPGSARQSDPTLLSTISCDQPPFLLNAQHWPSENMKQMCQSSTTRLQNPLSPNAQCGRAPWTVSPGLLCCHTPFHWPPQGSYHTPGPLPLGLVLEKLLLDALPLSHGHFTICLSKCY